MPQTTLAEAADYLAFVLSTPVVRLVAEVHTSEEGDEFAVLFCPRDEDVTTLTLAASPSRLGWVLFDNQTDLTILQRPTLRRLMTDILTPDEQEALDGALSA